jgi:hypothetical protein
MIVKAADVTLAGMNVSVKFQEKKESLRIWLGNENGAVKENSNRENGHSVWLPDEVSLSTESLQGYEAGKTEGDDQPPTQIEPRLELIRQILERVFDRKIRIFTLDGAGDATSEQTQEAQAPPETPATSEAQAGQAGYGIAYDYHESRYEAESTSFAAGGVVRTADGEEIRFSIGFSLSRESYSEQNLQIRAGDAVRKDPLVINFSGTSAQLSSVRFSFDLDADGTTENIPMTDANSGFLALDRNGDGRVTNGSELFGPVTGNGFQELSCFDGDGNNWIDERDPVFDELRVWRKDPAGSDTLTSLAAAGVGALYLGRQATPFDLKEADNSLAGQLRESGIYLSESGRSGMLQQLDLAV